jgi:hypothetical protein
MLELADTYYNHPSPAHWHTSCRLFDGRHAGIRFEDSRLQHYTPGAVAEFFAIELSGCLGPEAQGLCKVMAEEEGKDQKGSNPSTKVSPSVSKSTELFGLST